MSDPAALLPLAHRLADAAGDAIRPHFRTALLADDKNLGGAFDPVTVADRGGETAMRTLLDVERPLDGILGEEHGEKRGGPYRWVLDPVDGTRAFVSGLLSWGTLIGLEHEGVAVLGICDQPITGSRWWATPEGAFGRWDGAVHALRVRGCTRIEDAVVCCTTPDMFDETEQAAFERVTAQARFVRYGTDCMGYALLASGFVDLVIESSLQPYDIVAHSPIVEAAGGVVTTWDGRPAGAGGAVVAASTPALHAAALRSLQR